MQRLSVAVWVLALTIAISAGLVTVAMTGCEPVMGQTPSTVDVSATAADRFQPEVILVSIDDHVRWTNDGTDRHTVTADQANAAAGGPSSTAQYPAGVPAGESYEWTVPASAASGTAWYYHCQFHGAAGDGTTQGAGMAGTITVR